MRRAKDRRVRALDNEVEALCARGGDDDATSTEGLRTRWIRYHQYCERLAQSDALPGDDVP